ncbi:hypothetical protein C922_05171 [Plasmodium inui San Antonio 1]|uniref:Uncharacterized protein n=1 Tax=Plasmodium inui San Antonio 1 TaxID=1237626 RepID=W6ZU50_9APIC|nr:hypothetical protein C922_05171 [Plasmodium inui San Antonio 1]EUD64457.1 hypothetical protein C922_05171 [Plasmodium inui San Antonio 1]
MSMTGSRAESGIKERKHGNRTNERIRLTENKRGLDQKQEKKDDAKGGVLGNWKIVMRRTRGSL